MATKSHPNLSGLSRTATVVLLIGLLLLVATPLGLNSGAGFGGTDTLGSSAITEMVPGYEPWIEPFWEPPSAEIESMLFALQASVGGAIIGYVLGLRRGRAQGRNQPSRNAEGEDEEFERSSGRPREELCS